MSRPGMHRVYQTLLDGVPNSDWLRATSRIENERRAVDQYLESPQSHAYGFTTLLGHLDGIEMTRTEQAVVLESHLIEPSWQAPSQLRNLLLACKIEQLHHGGSGIHKDSYRSLLDALEQSCRPIRGNWSASYGSGDVIPAAWLMQDLREFDESSLLEHSGDLITLINGHYISTAFGLATAAVLTKHLGVFLEEWLPHCARPSNGLPAPLRDLLDQFLPAQPNQTRQPPVSMRDPTPVLKTMVRTVSRLGESVESRLQTPSANPLWAVSTGQAQPQSQASFLDFNLSFDLAAAIELVGLIGGLWQRLIEHTCADIGKQEGAHVPVQPPKAAQVVVDRMTGAGNSPRRFTGQESQGVEDLRDMSLQLTLTLHTQLTELDNLQQIWQQLSAKYNQPARSSEGSFGRRFLEIFLGCSQDTFSNVDAEQLLQTLEVACSGLNSQMA